MEESVNIYEHKALKENFLRLQKMYNELAGDADHIAFQKDELEKRDRDLSTREIVVKGRELDIEYELVRQRVEFLEDSELRLLSLLEKIIALLIDKNSGGRMDDFT